MRLLCTIILFLTETLLSAQLPSTQLYHFKLSQSNGIYRLSQPRWLNKFNPDGYNNQPFFFSEEEIYISARLPQDTSQTDIYALNLHSNILTRITATPESEYSPKPIPGSADFSVVRVDATKEKIQRLWKYPLNRTNGGRQIFNKMEGVGYYHWITTAKAILFIVKEPKNELYLVDSIENKVQKLNHVPGRCFAYTSSGKVVFTEKTANLESPVHILDPETLEDKIAMKTLPGSEDFVVAEDGTFFMGNNSDFYKYNPKSDKKWVLIANLRDYGIKKIERLALNKSGDLVMVCR